MSENLTGLGLTPLGILGGTFDPVHRAHLQLAATACQQLGFAQVLWIPSGNPPHRVRPIASADQRLAMTALAIQGEKRFVLDDSEVRSMAPSYSVNTLQRLRDKHDGKPLVLLLGADAYLGLASWYHWREIFGLAHIAVATRPGYAFDSDAMDAGLREETGRRHNDDTSCLALQAAGSLVTFSMPPLDISASAIRTKLATGEVTADLLPAPVLDYIAANHLYSYRSNH